MGRAMRVVSEVRFSQAGPCGRILGRDVRRCRDPRSRWRCFGAGRGVAMASSPGPVLKAGAGASWLCRAGGFGVGRPGTGAAYWLRWHRAALKPAAAVSLSEPERFEVGRMLQKGLRPQEGGVFVRGGGRIPPLPERAQKKGTAYTCRYRGPSG